MLESLAARSFASFIDRWPWETTGDWKDRYALPVAREVLHGEDWKRAKARLNGAPGSRPPSKFVARWAFTLYELCQGHWPERAWYEAERLALMVDVADR